MVPQMSTGIIFESKPFMRLSMDFKVYMVLKKKDGQFWLPFLRRT